MTAPVFSFAANGLHQAEAPERVAVTNQLLCDLAEARLWEPEADLFDSVQADVLDRLERDVYPAFRQSKTYQAVVNERAERVPARCVRGAAHWTRSSSRCQRMRMERANWFSTVRTETPMARAISA